MQVSEQILLVLSRVGVYLDASIDEEAGWVDLGVDSLSAMEAMQHIRR